MSLRVAMCQVQDVDESLAAWARQLGVTSVNITTAALPGEDGYWHTDDLVALRRKCEGFGITLEVIENTPIEFYDEIMWGGERRDEQLENYCRTIRNMAAAEIPMLGFHFMLTSVWRTSMAAPARGGALATAYDHALSGHGNQVEHGGRLIDRRVDRSRRVEADEVWANYAYFLDAVLPVADEVGVKLAQHPDDPPVDEIDGVARVFTGTTAFTRAEELAGGSPAWGIDLCLGTISEAGGAEEVERIIAHFVPRGRIRYVHFRDVQGTVPAFAECFLGEGNYHPPTVIRQLVDAGFDGWLQDDHVPFMTGDDRYGRMARAHEIGYIQGIFAALGV